MSITSPSIANHSLGAALSSLVASGATWKRAKDVGGNKTQRLVNIAYDDDSPLQSLDLYFPDDAFQEESLEPRSVYIHIHGGGWSRGGKSSPFYGGPSMCQNAAASGCIAVALGYRLGKFPEFMHDAATGIKWVQDNITQLGGDLTNVFLSGHSAGGHIASLLILRHASFLAPLDIPLDFFRGLILVSGVYDLFSPLRSAPLDAKNKWFVAAYVLPAFGSDGKLRREASPLLLLDPEKETSTLGTVALSITRRLSSSSSQLDSSKKVIDESIELNLSHIPPVLIMNASFDMGLDDNGKRMSNELSKYTDVKYVRVEGADHASICWNEFAANQVAEFVQAKTRGVDGVAAVKVTSLKRGRVRRDKRDKMPMCEDEDGDEADVTQ